MTTTHLQYIGQHPAKPAGELNVGDLTVWNGGAIEQVTSIDRETAATVWMTFDLTCQRKLRKTTLVGIREVSE